MADIVNLRQARQRRARAAKAADAAENRSRFGRTAAAKRRDADAVARVDRLLDSSRRDRPAGLETPAKPPDDTVDR